MIKFALIKFEKTVLFQVIENDITHNGSSFVPKLDNTFNYTSNYSFFINFDKRTALGDVGMLIPDKNTITLKSTVVTKVFNDNRERDKYYNIYLHTLKEFVKSKKVSDC